jgi:hypothetical protein
MAWTTITYSFGSVLTSTKMTQTQDNFTALAQGLTGAPKIQTAALEQTGGSQAVTVATVRPGTNNYVLRTSGAGAVEWSPVTIDEIGAATVAQAWLKTTTGIVATAGSTEEVLTLPGGEYGFFPQAKISASGGGNRVAFRGMSTSESYVTSIGLSADSGYSAYAQQRYVQASPPYDLGDGEIPLFIFVKLSALGAVLASYVAPEAPWHYNGPTDIRAERYSADRRGYRKMKQFIAEHGSIRAAVAAGMTRDAAALAYRSSPLIETEITQAIKNADMGLIPHPFGNLAAGETVVLLDPVSPLVSRLATLHEAGESISDVLHGGNLIVTNNEVVRAAPPGVLTVQARWKLT